MKAPKVTLSIRIPPETAIFLQREAERLNLRSTNEFVSQVIANFIKESSHE